MKKKHRLVRVEKDMNVKITIKYDWCIQITLKVKKKNDKRALY